MSERSEILDLPAVLFKDDGAWQIRRSIRTDGVRRDELFVSGGGDKAVDSFAPSATRCGFLRLALGQDRPVRLVLPANNRIKSCRAGGWVVLPRNKNDSCYWIPHAPVARIVTPDGHIAKEILNPVTAIDISAHWASLVIEAPQEYVVDVVLWQIPPQERELVADLKTLTTLETQPIFLWGSHTRYQRPADLYQHLIFGHVYENRFQWPFQRRSCSENDAHALYVALCGLARATGKKLYGLLKSQLLISVLARQSSDGGWRHGEWSEDTEAHMRLNGSAIHLLLDALDERDDFTVKQALQRAVEFISNHKDNTDVGTWFLHDSLELNEEGMKKSPFKWQPSRVLGKSRSNMLVLNTHLDCVILLHRYRQVTGDARYANMLDSARAATRAVLKLRPINCVYHVIFYLLRLTLLPSSVQRSLSLPLRALKRLAWKWLKPNLFRVTSRYPRFVMPGGYIERAIALRGVVDDYHSINVMDLLRYWRRFPEEDLNSLIDGAVAFVAKNRVADHWGEHEVKKYALGFWAEALYHRYLFAPDGKKLADLAETLVKLEQLGIGLPPSFLGANGEAVSQAEQIGSPSPSDPALRVANLSAKKRMEILVVNPTAVSRRLAWETEPQLPMLWVSCAHGHGDLADDLEIPAFGWIMGHANVASESSRAQRATKRPHLKEVPAL